MNTLVGNAVRLEPLATHHSAGLFEVLGNEDEAWRWMPHETPRSVEEFNQIVEGHLQDRAAGTREPFAVIHQPSGRVIGTTSFMDISRKDRALEIGSTIYAREFWRTSVNTECKLLLLTEAFEVQDFLRVALKTDSANERSQAAITRIGGIFEGRLRAHKIRPDGSSRDTLYYSILRNEWPDIKTRLQEVLS